MVDSKKGNENLYPFHKDRELAKVFWELIRNLNEDPQSSPMYFSVFEEKVDEIRKKWDAKQQVKQQTLSSIARKNQARAEQTQIFFSFLDFWGFWEDIDKATECNAILEIIRTDSSLQIIERIIERIKGIKEKVAFNQTLQNENIKKISKMHDEIGSNVLHCMAHALAYRIGCNKEISPAQWETYQRFSKKENYFSALCLEEDSLGRTANQIIEETGVSIGEKFFTVEGL